ncbi:MAG: hypothetical protein ACTSRA_02970 [Promethearchaeota archaeon]
MEPIGSKPKCYLKMMGDECIKVTSPNPTDVYCNQCLWNLNNGSKKSMKSLEILYARYKKELKSISNENDDSRQNQVDEVPR